MKKLIYLLAIAAIFFIAEGCSQESLDQNSALKHYNVHQLGEDQAIAVANKLTQKSTRRVSPEGIVVGYVLNDGTIRTRSNDLPDTLAYIVNYPDNGGFAVVCGDNRVSNILAYSPDGNLDPENEVIKANFYDGIAGYVSNRLGGPGDMGTDSLTVSPADEMTFCIEVEPKITVPLHGYAPFNKYWDIRYPGYPIGCVAVAATNVIANSITSLSYGGVTYNFEELLATIGLYTPSTPVGINTNGMGPEIGNEYDRAIDKMAKFMDQFCFSIGSHPAPDGPWTLASSSNAMNHLRNLGFDVLYYQYVADSVARDISANKLVYMDGRKVNDASKGHAFVVDGLG